MDASRVVRMLEAKGRVEEALLRSGLTVDATMREAIGWQMSAFVDRVGLSTAEAADRVIAVYLNQHPKAA